MKEYRLPNGKVVSEWELRQLNPERTYPQDLKQEHLTPFSIYVVEPVDAPVVNYTKRVERQGVELVAGVWKQKWVVISKTTEEITQHIEQLRLQKNQELNDAADAANNSQFIHEGNPITCDDAARKIIDGVAGNINLLGTFPEGFFYQWKTALNTYIPMTTVDDFKRMYASMTKQGSENFAKLQMLKNQLKNATTPEAINSIHW